MSRATNRAESETETNAAFLQHTPELTGFQDNHQEKGERERVEVEKWIFR